MILPKFDYCHEDLVAGLKQVGIDRGDIVFFQVCIDSLGKPKDCSTAEQLCEMLWGALKEVLGPCGTVLVPTYTFSFCRQQVFDIDQSATVSGGWNTFVEFPEYFRRLPNAIRSSDPIFSTAGIGPRAAGILSDLPRVCLGEDCVHDRLWRAGGKICILGVGLYESIFTHHMEAVSRVPWRYDKLFTGYVRENGKLRKEGWIYNVRILAKNGDQDEKSLPAMAAQLGVCKTAPVGRGEILAVSAQQFRDLIVREFARDPWFTAQGPPGDPVEFEELRIAAPRSDVSLPAHASMEQMINNLWRLPRDIISSGYDTALKALATQVPMTIHEYPTGQKCWTWIVPEKWTCYDAYIETLGGKRLFSHADKPLHVLSYSLPFEGEVTREELFKHLYVHSRSPDAVPFIYKHYDRDWGLCCSQNQKSELTEERYRVVIRTAFSYGTVKVGEVIAPGSREECIVLCAHMCHPGQVNDGMTGVVVGVAVMRELLRRRNRRYTYKFLIVPETIGPIAYLSQNEQLIRTLKGGIFLDMLGKDFPHALQLSFCGTTEIDRCFSIALKQYDPDGLTGPFRSLIPDDAVQFNAPGVRVPMLSLSRVLPMSDPDWPYREHHSDLDTPDAVSIKRLEESRALVMEMIDTIEQNSVPVNQFKGEIFCPRYGLDDWYEEHGGSKAFFDIMQMIDGNRSIADIATACNTSFAVAKRGIEELLHHGLVTLR
jgi:aminopeptidase-like protein/aminoglycoside N3'-acetyltransferase